MKDEHRPAGYDSSAGAVADQGKYRSVRGMPGEDIENKRWLTHQSNYRKQGRYAMQLPSERTATVIRAALDAGKKILIVGSKSGAYGEKIARHPQFLHLVSTEYSNHDRQAGSNVRADVAVVLLSKYLSVDLKRAVIDRCEERNIPCYGIFNSPGAITRVIEDAMSAKTFTNDTIREQFNKIAVPDTPLPAPQETPMVTTRPSAPQIAIVPSNTGTMPITPQVAAPASVEEKELCKMFDDAIAAIELCRDAAIGALRKAQTQAEASKKLDALKELLGKL